MGAIARKAQNQQMQPAQPANDLQSLLRKSWSRMAAVMPREMNPDRMYQLAVSTINTTPKLAECSSASVLSCLMKCSALGLEPSAVDGLGRAYILPFHNKKTGKHEATFILGYKGMIDLARRSGEIESIESRSVYEGDEFEFEFGLNEKLRHVPCASDRSDKALTHVYFIAKFKDGGHYVDVMTKAEVDEIRKRSKSANQGPWVTDYEAMARKTVVRRAFPYLPVSIEAKSAVAADETTGGYDDIFSGIEPIISEPVHVETIGVEEADGNAAESVSMRQTEDFNAVCSSCGTHQHIEEGADPDSVPCASCGEHQVMYV